jgi:hypothetical protein
MRDPYCSSGSRLLDVITNPIPSQADLLLFTPGLEVVVDCEVALYHLRSLTRPADGQREGARAEIRDRVGPSGGRARLCRPSGYQAVVCLREA